MASQAQTRWWGWGQLGHTYPSKKTDRVLAFLRKRLGFPAADPWPDPILEDLVIPEPSLENGRLQKLEAALPPGRLQRDDFTRLSHSTGKSYRDLVRLRAGQLNPMPAAVIYPESSLEVKQLLAAAAEQGIAVIPFGGGTSVVGGVEGPAGRPFVSLDMTGMARCLEIDATSRLATFEAGILGPALETFLASSGLTLGHFPQSFEFSSLGGWVATRSAGQNSTLYGKIEDMVLALKMETPGATFDSVKTPASATGPDLVACAIGSEGVLGVLTEITLRLQPIPEERRWRAFFFPEFEEAVDALRRMIQSGLRPAVARLADPYESFFALATQAAGLTPAGLIKSLALKNLRARARKGGSLLLLGFEGSPEVVERDWRAVRGLFKRAGAQDLGTGPADDWRRSRFDLPYLRDELVRSRIMVETIETATVWSNLMPLYERLHQEVAAALGADGEVPPVMTHISHLYPEGASLYVTFMAPQEEDAEDQWLRVKTSASEAILALGGTISHHHGVGRDHARWLAAEKGRFGMEALHALKGAFDPEGILNPGILLQ